eukprot:CAMPEP_0181314624 /NCGR_PEP_ID=MMETSP1101-20121128/14922_1 /TAXON_ID=46948 /ORGANISM="Rhodomonas abbreviata, Strain Caron Lab Isolate" /LENGTH=104 /DNA_ID=CAMNT_0023421739 /DNA_START=303 /DNA_END=618 /DNA_ORIENTATION=+
MARAGKKCMFEDDVRQLLGMPQPLESKVVADTSLEKSFSVHGKHSNVSRQMEDNNQRPPCRATWSWNRADGGRDAPNLAPAARDLVQNEGLSPAAFLLLWRIME